MHNRVADDDVRSPERVKVHYEVERQLADRLRRASKIERRHLYSSMYDELFRLLPDHPQLTRRSGAERLHEARAQVRFLKRLVNRHTTFLEVGAGDCALSVELAQYAGRVYALDVSTTVASVESAPTNFSVIISDGCSIPVPPHSVDVAYSNQLMEHLHPDDATEQLENIHRALVPGGIYVCVTPNRLTGPHDVSQHFDSVATGFHLKEYTITELTAMFRAAGFSRVRAFVGARGTYIQCAVAPLIACERWVCALPPRMRRAVVQTLLFRMLLNVRLGAIK